MAEIPTDKPVSGEGDNPFAGYIEDDDVVAVCLDCFNIIPDDIAERNPHLNAGKTGACIYCGGPMVVASRRAIPGLKAKREAGANLL